MSSFCSEAVPGGGLGPGLGFSLHGPYSVTRADSLPGLARGLARNLRPPVELNQFDVLLKKGLRWRGSR